MISLLCFVRDKLMQHDLNNKYNSNFLIFFVKLKALILSVNSDL
jgi:hypothetical protein